MRHHATAAWAATLILAIAGCQSMEKVSPQTHVHNARAVYVVAVQTATDLAKAGLIPLETAEQIEAVRIRAAALLAAADEAVEAGAEFGFADLRETIQTLANLLAIVAQGGER